MMSIFCKKTFNILLISFNGDVVGEFERSNATHIVSPTDKEVGHICSFQVILVKYVFSAVSFNCNWGICTARPAWLS